MTRVEHIAAARLLLRAGKSLCLVGPPGSGKTRLAFRLAEDRGYGYEVAVGYAELTYRELVDPETGALARSVVRTWARYLCGETPVWLVFDEVNRANVEVVLGEVFTLLDLEYRTRLPALRPGKRLGDALREAARLECGGGGEALAAYAEKNGLPLPLAWRMIATMNLYDMAHLHRIGYALARRAPLLPVTGDEHRVEPEEEPRAAQPPRPEACREAVRILYEEIPASVRREPWSLIPRDILAAYEAPAAPLNSKAIADRLAATPSPIWSVLREVAAVFKELGLLPGPGLYADTCRILAANYTMAVNEPLVVADVVVASLLAPQLTYAVPRIRLEAALGYRKALDALQRLRERVARLLGPRSLSAWAIRAYTAQLPVDTR